MRGSLNKIMQEFLHVGGNPKEITRNIPSKISNGIAVDIPEGVHEGAFDSISV